ncbi:helix-turn-helix domain-containing protein [Achromobacter sp. GG226]|uniref:IclR family transcriptional regulator n=1 Tax=Verticiella alkaliphila TaxID=2779529 RepID=UPI001C0D80EC|nr:helix-turn-helix domain-containing protein [Verticiella sp. GG226]MBU4611879.1 helix-turn-helix domain-containing protein [Verticiella sp. GG226]
MKEDRLFVTALARGLELLRCFTPDRPELGTTELARLTGLPQPTVWRLCHTLQQLGYLIPTRAGDRLRAGPGVLTLGSAAVTHGGVAESAYPFMKAIAMEFDASISLAERHRTEMVIVQRAEAASIRRLILYIGSAVPLTSTSLGGAYLAAAPAAVRAELTAELQAAEGADPQAVARDIAEAVAQYEQHGHVLNLGRTHPDINAVAVPIVSRDGRRIMALTCGANRAHTPPEKLAGPMAQALHGLAARIAPMLDGDPMGLRERLD